MKIEYDECGQTHLAHRLVLEAKQGMDSSHRDACMPAGKGQESRPRNMMELAWVKGPTPTHVCVYFFHPQKNGIDTF